MRRKDKRVYWLWLSHACGQGSACAVELVRNFGDAEAVFDADADELDSCGVKIEKRTMSKLCLKDTEEVEEILEWCDNLGVRVLYPGSDGYPKGLLSLRDAPMVLYCIGDLPDFDKTFSCAVVGTRSMSAYGRDVSYALGAGLADCGACVISGLALGIDGMAMAGAVEAGGACVAVLGCGVDTAYPKAHEKLLQSVLERGAVISEYAPGTSPLASHFPVRNRIISGMSCGVLVVEAGEKSGTMITANCALEQGRTVYAVPGRITDRMSFGTNELIRKGMAEPVFSAEDLLFHLGINPECSKKSELRGRGSSELKLTGNQKILFDLIELGEKNFDEICELTQLPVEVLNLHLTELEFSGLIKQLPGRIYTLS